jgi:hypothetical protein
MSKSKFPRGWDAERVKQLVDRHESASDDEITAADETSAASSYAKCPFAVGDVVVFMPSVRSRSLYQNIGRFSVRIGQTLVIQNIRDDVYLYFEGGVGGWPWNEFSRAIS